MSHPRCVYCGHRSRDGKTTCGYHADLIELDDLSGLEDSRENFKVWWRERFTLPEITALAAFIDPEYERRQRTSFGSETTGAKPTDGETVAVGRPPSDSTGVSHLFASDRGYRASVQGNPAPADTEGF